MPDMIDQFGWSPAVQSQFVPFLAQGFSPARVTAQHRGLWRLVTVRGEAVGRLSGRFAAEAATGGYPVVGDWLAVSFEGEDEAVIQALVPRRTVFTRRAAGGVDTQVVAANVDVAFLVATLSEDVNLRRLERYLVAARDSGADVVIVLTKADLILDPKRELQRVEEIAAGAPVVLLSAINGEGLDALDHWLKPGLTAALLGSSGAGKSTLLNALAGHILMPTGATRASDDHGRHTTTHRELFRLPNGALLVDTPGMRELGLVSVEEGLDISFNDVTALAAQCRFGNCAHQTEPGCAILAALADGGLSQARWDAYMKLTRELASASSRVSPAALFSTRVNRRKAVSTRRASNKRRPDEAG